MYDIKCNTSTFVITITSSSLLIYTFKYTPIKCSKRLESIIAHINSYTRSGYTSSINQSLLYKSDKSDNEAFTHCMMCVYVCVSMLFKCCFPSLRTTRVDATTCTNENDIFVYLFDLFPCMQSLAL